MVKSSWAPHAVPGWYLGPALKHYRCFRVWARAARAERIKNTLEWLRTTVPMPVPPQTDLILAAAKDLTAALLPPAVSLLPNTAQTALQALGTIFADYAPRVPGPTAVPSVDPDAPNATSEGAGNLGSPLGTTSEGDSDSGS
jgi:hypothetical protein